MHDERLAKAYQKYSAWQFQNGLRLFKLASPKPNEVVLDVGCGTGQLTYEFAKAVFPHGEVVAIDPNSSRISLSGLENSKLLFLDRDVLDAIVGLPEVKVDDEVLEEEPGLLYNISCQIIFKIFYVF